MKGRYGSSVFRAFSKTPDFCDWASLIKTIWPRRRRNVKSIKWRSPDSVKGLFVSKILTLYLVGSLVENGDEKTSQKKQSVAGRFYRLVTRYGWPHATFAGFFLAGIAMRRWSKDTGNCFFRLGSCQIETPGCNAPARVLFRAVFPSARVRNKPQPVAIGEVPVTAAAASPYNRLWLMPTVTAPIGDPFPSLRVKLTCD